MSAAPLSGCMGMMDIQRTWLASRSGSQYARGLYAVVSKWVKGAALFTYVNMQLHFPESILT